jgi:hypothetical protein
MRLTPFDVCLGPKRTEIIASILKDEKRDLDLLKSHKFEESNVLSLAIFLSTALDLEKSQCVVIPEIDSFLRNLLTHN